ncbi:MAG TPA: molybdate ABC transporter substrate-binding protein, partial [Chloroflexota bacterium]|nr:molybdate ABC transporter substrate-binding protein [Chloroflexota bacterium]
PFNELGPAFGAANGATVTFNYAATTQLRTQLEQGARADVLASANVQQMDAAAKSGVVVGERPVFAQNKLVVILPKGNPGNVERLEQLARPDLKLVITQRDVPVGVYTRDALDRMSKDARFGPAYASKVLANVRSEEANVKQLVAKVQLGEADAAFVYSSDVSAAVSAELKTIEVPDQFNTIADYPVAAVKDAPQPALAQAFIRYLLGDAGRTVLAKHNFILPGGRAAASIVPRA